MQRSLGMPLEAAQFLDCRERWITCTLTIPQLGINGAPLDDVIDPLLARWEALYGQFMLKLQYHQQE